MKRLFFIFLLAALLLTACAAPAPSPEPTPEPEPAPPEPVVYTLSFVGDCTLATSQYYRGSATAFETVVGDNSALPFSGTVDYFTDDSLTVANLECTFVKPGTPGRGLFYFAAKPDYVGVLTAGGVDMVTMANNHSADFGKDGLAQTRETLQQAGIAHAGENEWTLVETPDGLTVGFYCTGSDLRPQTAPCVEAIAQMRQAGAELCVVLPHWGTEGSYRPTAAQRTLAKAAIDAGADLVVGSHPHVLQPVEEYAGGLVAFSLGNYVFGGNNNPRDKDTAILQVSYTRREDGTLERTAVELIPCSLTSTPGRNDYRPVPYAPDSTEAARTLSKLDGSFTGPDLVVNYSAYLNPPAAPEETPGAAEGEVPGDTPAELPGEAPGEVPGETPPVLPDVPPTEAPGDVPPAEIVPDAPPSVEIPAPPVDVPVDVPSAPPVDAPGDTPPAPPVEAPAPSVEAPPAPVDIPIAAPDAAA